MSWERTKARISHPAGLCVLALFLVFLYVEFTQEGGASSSFMLFLALANLGLTIWAGAAEKERERREEQRRHQVWGETGLEPRE